MMKLRLHFNRHNLLWVGLVIAFLILLTVPAFLWMKKTNHERAERRKSLLSPVIMVPGSSATINRFDELIEKLNAKNPHPHSVLKAEVDTKGKITYHGEISRRDNEPLIVIGFENNHDGYENIKKQAGWLDNAFYEISQSYKFNNFKAFGHSNGGLVWTYWLEHYYSDYKSEITMKRLMTLGSPYNFSESNINRRTTMLSDFIKYRKKIPRDLTVYSLSGGRNYTSDGIVPEASVEAAKYIFQNQAKHFTQMTVTGTEADHSDLPQNAQVVQLIKQDLLAKKSNAKVPGVKHKNKIRKVSEPGDRD